MEKHSPNDKVSSLERVRRDTFYSERDAVLEKKERENLNTIMLRRQGPDQRDSKSDNGKSRSQANIRRARGRGVILVQKSMRSHKEKFKRK